MKLRIIAFAAAFFAVSAQAGDIDVVDQRYIDQLTRGGNVSIKQAAQSIYNTGERDTEVLDVAAEVLLKKYPNASRSDADTLAWLCKALGASGNNRYSSALNKAAEGSGQRAIGKHCGKAAKDVGDPSGAQYTKGSASSKPSKSKAKAVAKKSSSSGKAGLDVVVVGMSIQEVYDLIGQPTATSTHQTGKGFNPFNFGGKDLARTHLLYKGKGRVVTSHDRFSSTSKVLEVIINPDETGYP